MPLDPLQEAAVYECRQAIASGKKSIIMYAPCGGGKGVVISHMIEMCAKKNKKSLVFTERRKIRDQISRHISNRGVLHGTIAAGHKYDKDHRSHVAMIQTVAARMDGDEKYIAPEKTDLCIVDECFPCYVKIDGRPISEIRAGDHVMSFNHETRLVESRRVVQTFKSRPATLITIHFASGKQVTCTSGHPFFSNGEYVEAFMLNVGQLVSTICDYGNNHANIVTLPALRKSRRQDRQEQEFFSQEKGFLLERVRICGKGGGREEVWASEQVAQRERLGQNEGRQPHAQSRDSRQGIRVYEASKGTAGRTGREWSRGNEARADDCGSSWLEDQCCGANKKASRIGVSNVLQVGCSEQGLEDWHRGGWEIASDNREEGSGCQKRRVLSLDRVDRIEIHEPAGGAGFGNLCPDGFVYNFEVEGNHNYFANGFLVHNCHKYSTPKRMEILSKFAPRIGFTATPVNIPDADAMIRMATHRQLIDSGRLVPIEVIGADEIDMEGVKRVKREYSLDEFGKRVRQSAVFGNVLQWYRRANPWNLPTITFAPLVKESMWLVDQFNEAGVPSVHMDANTHEDDREKMFEDHKAGKIVNISSPQLLTEGVDLPYVHYGILLRPCGPWETFIQTAGRLGRACDGKTKATLIDHVGATARHGHPQADIDLMLGDTSAEIEDRRKEALSKPKQEGEPDREDREPIRCPKCGTMRTPWLIHEHQWDTCWACGHKHVKTTRSIIMVDGTLKKIHGEKIKQKKQKTYGDHWESMIFRAANSNMTLNQMRGLFFRERGVWPDKSFLPERLCPDSQIDGHRRASDIFSWAVRKPK